MMRKVKYIAISDLSEMTLAFAVTPSAACLLNASLASDHDMLVQIIQKVVKLLLSFLKDELGVVVGKKNAAKMQQFFEHEAANNVRLNCEVRSTPFILQVIDLVFLCSKYSS